MLQYQTIEPGTLQLLKSLQSMSMFQGLRLVGGTALALQLGHRKSIDLDLFGTIEADPLEIREALEESHTVSDSDITLASIKDIAAMKIAAVIGRGTKKDFIDIDILLRSFTLQELLELYMQKYPDGTLFIAMKSLTYFEDAESDPMPFMFEETDWEDVKTRIREAVIGL